MIGRGGVLRGRAVWSRPPKRNDVHSRRHRGRLRLRRGRDGGSSLPARPARPHPRAWALVGAGGRRPAGERTSGASGPCYRPAPLPRDTAARRARRSRSHARRRRSSPGTGGLAIRFGRSPTGARAGSQRRRRPPVGALQRRRARGRKFSAPPFVMRDPDGIWQDIARAYVGPASGQGSGLISVRAP